jgi:hypothetical protein
VPPSATVLAHLHALLARLDRRAERLARSTLTFSRARLVLALVGAAGALVVGARYGAGAGWALAAAFLVAFAVVARFHDRVEQARARLRRWQALQARHVARLGLDWAALPNPPEPTPPDHPFAADLDLAGPRSVLHLLDTAATTGGRARLRAWLLDPRPDPEAVRIRQARVRALVERRRLRDRLALLGLEAAGDDAGRWDDAPIRAWLTAPAPDTSLRRWALGLGALAAATAVLAALDLAGGPAYWPYPFLPYVVLYLWRYGAFATVFDRAYDLQRAVAEVAPALRFLETDPAASDPAPVWAPFRGPDRPSLHLARLRRLTAAAAVTKNDLGRLVLNALLPYDLLLALALHRLRGHLARVVPAWLDAYYEVEALAALAAYADFRPGRAAFPELLDGPGEGPLLEARALGHPLLPAPVPNDVALAPGEVVVVTGSNMAGKSTFLRAAGVATVLAWTGGAVDAGTLRLRPLRVFTSMRLGDALQEGVSTFYAEVRRLRALLDAVAEPGAPPVLVLIDEMLRGTNNRERLAGAQAVVRALAGGPAVTLVATHDLALADLAAEHPAVRNAHFREEAVSDHLTFDYRLRPGPCPTTNALVIMHRAGLPVAPQPRPQ